MWLIIDKLASVIWLCGVCWPDSCQVILFYFLIFKKTISFDRLLNAEWQKSMLFVLCFSWWRKKKFCASVVMLFITIHLIILKKITPCTLQIVNCESCNALLIFFHHLRELLNSKSAIHSFFVLRSFFSVLIFVDAFLLITYSECLISYLLKTHKAKLQLSIGLWVVFEHFVVFINLLIKESSVCFKVWAMKKR